MTVLRIHDDDGHARETLGLHAMGALREDLATELKEHLDRCEVCRAELYELYEVTFALALVSLDEVETLVEAPVSSDGEFATTPIASLSQPTSSGWPRAGSRIAVRMNRGRRLPLRWMLLCHARLMVVAAAFALVVGFTASLLLKASNAGAAIATAAAYADNQIIGSSLSVSASALGNVVSIHALLDGLVRVRRIASSWSHRMARRIWCTNGPVPMGPKRSSERLTCRSGPSLTSSLRGPTAPY